MWTREGRGCGLNFLHLTMVSLYGRLSSTTGMSEITMCVNRIIITRIKRYECGDLKKIECGAEQHNKDVRDTYVWEDKQYN